MNFGLPVFPGPWIGWLLILLTRYGLLKAFSRRAFEEADEVPVFTGGDRAAHKVHIITSMILMLMSPFLTFRFDMPVGPIGIIMLVIGWFLYTLSFYHFSRREPGKPAAKGIFSVSRHPVHLSFMMTQYGLCLATLSIPYTIVTITYHIASEIMIRAEEIECRQRYRDEYKEYEKKVRRYIGRYR